MKIPILRNNKLSSDIIGLDIARTSDMGADNDAQDNNIENLKGIVDNYVLPTSFATRLKGTLQAGSGISITSIDDNCTVSANLSASNKVFEIVQDNLALTSADNSILYLVTGFDTSEPIGIWAYIGASDGDPSDSSLWIHADDLSGDFSNYSTSQEMNDAISFALSNQLSNLGANSNLNTILASQGYAVETDMASALSLKANQIDVYDRESVDGLLAAKANQSTTYSKTETDSAIASAVGAIPEPPTALSQLTNDSGYAVQSQVDSEIATAVGSLSNNAGQVKIRFTNLTTGTTGFSANTPIILSIRAATASIVPFPITVWDRNSIKNAINTYELGFFVQGADESGDRLREANISQSTRWRVAGNYTGKDPSTLGRLRCFISNPDTGFRASSAVIVPSSITDDDFTFEFTTIADSGSMSQGSGYQIGFETSFDDPGLTVSVNSIVRIGEAMENAII